MARENIDHFFSSMKKRRRRIFSKFGFWPTILHGTRYEGLLLKKFNKHIKAIHTLDEIISLRHVVRSFHLTHENYQQVISHHLNKRQKAIWGESDPLIIGVDMSEPYAGRPCPDVPHLRNKLVPFMRAYEYFLTTGSYKCE